MARNSTRNGHRDPSGDPVPVPVSLPAGTNGHRQPAGRPRRPRSGPPAMTRAEADQYQHTPAGAKIWGRSGTQFMIGAEDDIPVTIAIYRNRGIMQFEEWLKDHYPPRMMAPDLSVGAAMVDAANAARSYGPLTDVLRWAVMEHEAITEDVVIDSEAEKLIAILNAFWDQSGLRYLEQMALANASAVWAATLEALRAAAPALGEANAQAILRGVGIGPGSTSPAER